jgi:ABC-type polysaccharide/polyol phosphate transport system ATPase subunit
MNRGSLSAPKQNSAKVAAIEVENVSKTFRLPHERRTTLKEHFLHPFRHNGFEEQRALQDVTFRVEEGEFFGVIGPNGSGKSTLLKIIAGIYRQDSGRVQVTGLLSPFIELGVGFNPELTARDNIRINGTLLGLTRRELQARYDAIVAFSELERFVDQKLKNFSSGMQVRLAYAIAIQVDFDVLLLDEVLAVGDAAFQEKCFATFDRFRDLGRTIVLVTHDLGVIEHFADRVALLINGQVRALGSSDEVTERYQSLAAQAAADTP